MSEDSHNLVLHIKANKSSSDKAKVQIEFERITLLGGILLIMEKFDVLLSGINDLTLRLRTRTSGYQYSENIPLSYVRVLLWWFLR